MMKNGLQREEKSVERRRMSRAVGQPKTRTRLNSFKGEREEDKANRMQVVRVKAAGDKAGEQGRKRKKTNDMIMKELKWSKAHDFELIDKCGR
jgi:hypothetical protein